MKPKGNILLVFYLFLFFIGTILLMGANAADEDPSLYGRGEEPPPVYDEGEPFELLNLCGVSKIRDNEQTEYTRNVESVLTAVVDEDPNTYLTKSCTPDQWLEIRFPGARKWVNFVEIQYTGKDDFKFEIFNFKGETQEINVISADLRGIFGSSKIKTIEFEPVRAKGIRWSWATAGSADQRINIYEISAWFYQPDPDDQVDSDLDDRVSGQKTVSETVPPAKLPPANAPVAKDGTLPDTKQTPGTIPDYGMGTGLPKGGKALLSEGFEGAWPPPGWTVIQTHTGTSHPIPSYWSQTDYTVHSGTYAAGLWWDYGHQDEWLITPAVLLDGACFLSFWTYGWEGSTHGDHYYVKVSTDGGTSWDVVFDLSELTLGDWNAWDYPYTIDLSAYSGQVVNIAFHAQDPPDNDGLWYIWVIDDVYLNPYPDPDPNDPTNWLLCETCDPIIGPPDITPLWNRISTRPGWCPGASHWCHLWVPPADWSGDFRRAAAGGGENSHVTGYTGMDYHDLSVIACHGCPCRISFSTGPPAALSVLDAQHPRLDIWHSWGNRDAEWFCALSCSPYAWPNCPWWWAQGFNGLHLQCGFTTTAWATGGAFLGGFARLMTNNFFPLPISLSWFIARARWQGAGTCVIALADDWRAYFDHLWGYGYVSPDPSLANGRLRGIVWAIWDPPFSEKESKSREYPPPLTTKQQQSIWEIISGPSSKTIPARSSVGMPVKTTEELYTSDLVDSMTVYYLVPLPVDSAFVQNLADGFCMNYGILCVPEMGQDDEGNWWATEDEFALWGDPENGVIQFVNTDEYVAKKSTPPGVPDPGSAILYAQTLLMDLGLDPTGSYSTGYTYNIQTAYDLDLEEIVPDSSFDLSINAEFIRIVEGFPVFGPGGYITATWGEGYGLQHLTRGGWHDLVDPIGQSIIDVTEAIDVLTTTGEDGTIGGIPPICDTLLIDFVELAYYNTNGEYETDILEPIYHFSCYAASEYDTVPCDVYVPALHLPPGGSIDAPPDGSAFAEGDTVTFIGSATGGLPPYTFQWYSSEDGYLGSGDTLSIDNLSIAWKDSVLIAHTITLIVTDFNALTDNVTISVFIGFVRGNANGDAVIDIGDVVYLINYLFTGTSAPDPLEAGDANCDGVVDIGDVIYLINYLFTGTTPPGCY